MTENIWQMCPKCDGDIYIGGFYNVCPICNGEYMVSILTGKPPSVIIAEAEKLSKDLSSTQEHLDEYIDDQLEDISSLFLITYEDSIGPRGKIKYGVQKVKRLLLDIYKTGKLGKSSV